MTSSPQSLPDRLAKAMLEAKFGAERLASRAATEYVTEALVPAVLAALTVEPDGRITDDDAKAPYWRDVALVSPRLIVWPDGVDEEIGGFLDAEDITPDEVERAGLVMFSVAAEMRKYEAWKEQR